VTSVESGLTVGFDLDMTLIDSRPGIAAVFRALSAETGVDIDADAAVNRLGPPLNDELALWFPADQVEGMADRYRALYPSLAVEPSPFLPGAADAIAAVREAGGKVIVITSKAPRNAALHLEHLGVPVDHLEGWAFADGKRDALLKHHVNVYVGDYTADMIAATAAGDVTAVGVLSGPCDGPTLTAAGADVVLPDLRAFRGWLTDFLGASKPLGSGTSSR
jgi:phosphoglycolate phosphatase